eukprot:gb/GECH01008843.1/.p1 GENE.gb/GECH01008843.1/~~gb/GECH01008843.1/.p1  ORF type:complete len:568 (+),score=99.33 gb/GECH01008843.1/:1-1704(+)
MFRYCSYNGMNSRKSTHTIIKQYSFPVEQHKRFQHSSITTIRNLTHSNVNYESKDNKSQLINSVLIQRTQRLFYSQRFSKNEKIGESKNIRERDFKNDQYTGQDPIEEEVSKNNSIAGYTWLALFLLLISFYYGNTIFLRAGGNVNYIFYNFLHRKEEEYSVALADGHDQYKSALITLCSIGVNYMNWPLIMNTGTVERLTDALTEETDSNVLFHVLRCLTTLAENKNIVRDAMEENVSFDALFRILDMEKDSSSLEATMENDIDLPLSRTRLEQVRAYAGDLMVRIIQSQMSHYMDFRYDDSEKRYDYKTIINLMRLTKSNDFIQRRTAIESLALLKRHVMSKEMISTLEKTVEGVIDYEPQRRNPDKVVINAAKTLQKQIAYYKKMQENEVSATPPKSHQISNFSMQWRSSAQNAVLIVLGGVFWNVIRYRMRYYSRATSLASKQAFQRSVIRGRAAIGYSIPFCLTSIGGDQLLRYIMVSRSSELLAETEGRGIHLLSLGVAGARAWGAFHLFKNTPFLGFSVFMPTAVFQDIRMTSRAIGYAWNITPRLLIKRPDRSFLGKLI